jgi:hypothetical protein
VEQEGHPKSRDICQGGFNPNRHETPHTRSAWRRSLRCGSKHFLVSSKVLILPCRYFDGMLTRGWGEGQYPRSQESPQRTNLDGYPADGLELLCKIIPFHDLGSVETSEMDALATVCDYQGSAHVEKYFVRTCIAGQDYSSKGWCDLPEMLSYLWISYVFGISNVIEQVTGRLAAIMGFKMLKALDVMRPGLSKDLKVLPLRLEFSLLY